MHPEESLWRSSAPANMGVTSATFYGNLQRYFRAAGRLMWITPWHGRRGEAAAHYSSIETSPGDFEARRVVRHRPPYPAFPRRARIAVFSLAFSPSWRSA